MEENARKRIEKDIEMNIVINAYIDIINRVSSSVFQFSS